METPNRSSSDGSTPSSEPGARTEAAKFLASLSPTELVLLQRKLYRWETWARPSQLEPPGDWRFWLLLTGRGWGKTRTCAEWIRKRIDAGAERVTLVGRTAADVRDIMVEGESGLLSVFPNWQRPRYEPSNRRIVFHTGAEAALRSADEPDQLRGLQHEFAWCDELAAWSYPDDAFDNMVAGLRLGPSPRCVIGTTPRPIPLVKRLVGQPDVVLTRGATHENLDNLPALEATIHRYEGTAFARQELYGEILDAIEGSLLRLDQIGHVAAAPELTTVLVGVDPAATSRAGSDETGIVVAGRGIDGRGYVLADRTCRLPPDGWARRAIEAYHAHEADAIVAEVNQGGEMVEHTLRTIDRRVPVRVVRASRGKHVRAEPITSLYAQGQIVHVGEHRELEAQLVAFTAEGYEGGDSPDRADAAIWALSELMLDAQPEFVVV
jgi:predicted phage terminase large subunit-like protein